MRDEMLSRKENLHFSLASWSSTNQLPLYTYLHQIRAGETKRFE